MILLIDNYDSFVYNLKRYFVQLGQDVVVVRNDDASIAQVLSETPSLRSVSDESLAREASPWSRMGFESPPTALVISPGPKSPQDAGYCLDLVRKFSGQLPMLGVCLGHQIIFEAFGGRIVRASKPVHGQVSRVELSDSRLFAGLGQSAEFARYHSLICEASSLPQGLRVSAWNSESANNRQIMAIEHQQFPIFGVQFHPESILSAAGMHLLRNFLEIVGISSDEPLPEGDLIEANRPSSGIVSELDIGVGEHAVVLPELRR